MTEARDTYLRYEQAFSGIEAPLAFVDVDAIWHNAAGMLRRAAGKPIRVASKSIRCRGLLERILAHDRGFHGLLTFSLRETLWLSAKGFADLLVGYPTVDRTALARLKQRTADEPDTAPVLMVDCAQHLDLIESAARSDGPPIRVAIDIDMGYWIVGGRLRIGLKRSPVHTAEETVRLVREIEGRRAVRLVGLMAYEGQIAGVGDRREGAPLRNASIRFMQRRSATEIRERRGAIVEAVGRIVELEFVNGGGTGSIELTASESCVTEVAAGSGLTAPATFDDYRAFALRPAEMFALPVVRRPAPDVVTVGGGGYVASGPANRSHLPRPHLPAGLRIDKFEGPGDVQTPLLGSPARDLRVGDRVYFRPAKAGQLCEHFDSLYLVSGSEVVDELPTYRGEGCTASSARHLEVS